MSAVLAQDRLSEVVAIIIEHRTGATLEEIVEAAKRGYVTEGQAVKALERQYRQDARHKQEREIPCGEMLAGEASPELPEEVVLREEARNLLLRTINALPVSHRRAAELYWFDGYTQEQIGQRLGVAHQTVSRYLAAANRIVVQSMDESGAKLAPKLVTITRAPLVESLMRLTYRQMKAHHRPVYPYELWHRYNIGAGWAANGRFCTRYVDKLPQYLAACFDVPPVIPRDV